jgi:hypothetical protein
LNSNARLGSASPWASATTAIVMIKRSPATSIRVKPTLSLTDSAIPTKLTSDISTRRAIAVRTIGMSTKALR